MKIQIVGHEFRNQWNSFVYANDCSIAWQIWDWSAIVARFKQFTFLPVAALRGSEIQGIVPLYLWNNGSSRAFLSVPHAVAGGICAIDSETEQALLSFAIDLARKYEPCPITLKQYKHKIASEQLSSDENYYNKELSLQNDKSFRREFAPYNVQMADQARALGMKVVYPFDDTAAFYAMLIRYSHKQGVPCDALSWIASLIDAGMYSAAVAFVNGQPIAGTMIKKFKKTVSFPFSWSLPQNFEQHSIIFGLYMHLIEHFADEKLHIFHSGRIPDGEDVPKFRLGWGGPAHRYYYQYYPARTNATEFATKRGLKRKLFQIGWRRLPLPLIKALGPHIVKRFP